MEEQIKKFSSLINIINEEHADVIFYEAEVFKSGWIEKSNK